MPQDKTISILITAMGGDLGQSVAKALRLADFPLCIIGCDADKDSAAMLFCDTFVPLPKADTHDYIEQLSKVAKNNQCQLIIPCSEIEIYTLSRFIAEQHEGILPCPVICQPWEQLQIYLDKLACYKYLSKNVSILDFADAQDEKSVKKFFEVNTFPCVVKGRCSSGSRHIHIVKSQKEFDAAVAAVPMPLVQAYIDATYGEYSVGVFAHNEIQKCIAFRRTIGVNGASWTAHTELNNLDILNYAHTLAQYINMQGSYNIQLRHGANGIGLLEINPRFSSLVAARAISSFNDGLWSVLKALNMTIIFTEEYKEIKFKRFVHEAVNFGDGFVCLKEWAPTKRNV